MRAYKTTGFILFKDEDARDAFLNIEKELLYDFDFDGSIEEWDMMYEIRSTDMDIYDATKLANRIHDMMDTNCIFIIFASVHGTAENSLMTYFGGDDVYETTLHHFAKQEFLSLDQPWDFRSVIGILEDCECFSLTTQEEEELSDFSI